VGSFFVAAFNCVFVGTTGFGLAFAAEDADCLDAALEDVDSELAAELVAEEAPVESIAELTDEEKGKISPALAVPYDAPV
jgi:F0F1-type ATP synthase delta subunit